MIEVQNLSRFYANNTAISDLTFKIQDNEIVGFLGLNGAGKSTTLKILACLLEASSGEVTIDGENLATANVTFRSKIGFLPEEPPLYKEMTVSEFLMYLGQLRGKSKQDILTNLPSVLKKCQLQGHEHQLISQMSLGYRKRVGIAQAIIHSPKLVILDEPISGLDPYQIVEMREVIRNLSKDATILLSSHNLSEVAETCDRLLVLHEGKLIAQGTTQELSSTVRNQQRSIELTVHSNGVDVQEVLNAIPSVSKTVFHTSDSICDVTIYTSAPTTNLVRTLIEKGIDVSRVINRLDELEEIFLSLTQGEKQ